LAISGSLGAVSSNAAVLHAVAILAPRGVEVGLYDGLAFLPHFNPDLDGDPPAAAVQKLRHEIEICDGLLICSPEYAHGAAGSLKNALDWLVARLTFPGKPVALINASSRASHADAQLQEILATMSARLIESASIRLAIPAAGSNSASIISDPLLGGQIRNALDQFVAVIAADKDARSR
jgi:chromate reductase, NAD(P)H dehydrogenase (quinone)